MHAHVKKFLLLLFIALLATACGGKGNPTPTPAPTPQAVATTPAGITPQPTATKAEQTRPPEQQPTPTSMPTPNAMKATPSTSEENMPHFVTTAQSAFKSYRAHMTVRIKIPQKNIDTVLFSMDIAATRNPAAEQITMKSAEEMNDGQGQMVEFVRIGKTVWMNLDGTWIQASSQEMSSMTQELNFFDPNNIDGRWKKIGREKIAGVETTHYRLELNQEQDLMNTEIMGMDVLDKMLGGDQTWTITPKKLIVDVYATKDGVVIANQMRWQGTVSNGQDTFDITESYEYSISDINADITIKPPKEAPTQEEVIPLPEGATLQVSMGGLRTYTVPDATVADVAAFLQQELPNQGFTITNKQNLGQLFSITAEKEGTRYSINVTAGDNNSVQIMIQTAQ